jgi:hypothetical protein
MISGLDHLVILVEDLGQAMRGYERLGFVVAPGGEHADGLTRNALIPLHDGSYLEIVAFLDPDNPRDNVWRLAAFRRGRRNRGSLSHFQRPCVGRRDDTGAWSPGGGAG